MCQTSSTAEQGENPEKQYHSVTERAKKIWSQQQNEELVHMSKRDICYLWKVFKTSKGSACPIALAAQFDTSISFMGSHPEKHVVQASGLAGFRKK